MQDMINELVDHHRIRQMLERYCRGIDRLDAELIDSVYWEDSTDDHGIYTGPGKEFAAFIVPMLREAFDCTLHFIGQSNIQIAGNRASGDTYFVAYHTRRDGETRSIDVAGGRYADKLEKRGDEWRIKDRIVVMDWVESRDGLENSQLNLGDFVPGLRNREDASYDAAAWAAGQGR